MYLCIGLCVVDTVRCRERYLYGQEESSLFLKKLWFFGLNQIGVALGVWTWFTHYE